jgi:WD40 repeat protein
VATGADDNTARVWDAATAEPLTPPLPFAGTVHDVRFSPDGKLLLAVGKGPAARVWDAAGAGEIAAVPRDVPWVAAALAGGTGPWDLPADRRPAAELAAVAEWLSGHRVDPAGGLVPLDGGELRQAGERAARR